MCFNILNAFARICVVVSYIILSVSSVVFMFSRRILSMSPSPVKNLKHSSNWSLCLIAIIGFVDFNMNFFWFLKNCEILSSFSYFNVRGSEDTLDTVESPSSGLKYVLHHNLILSIFFSSAVIIASNPSSILDMRWI